MLGLSPTLEVKNGSDPIKQNLRNKPINRKLNQKEGKTKRLLTTINSSSFTIFHFF